MIVSALAALVAITGLLAWAFRQELRHRARLPARHRASEAGIRLLTEHASDLVSRVGQDGTCQYMSPAATRMSGVPAEALLGRGLQDLIRPEDLPREGRGEAAAVWGHGGERGCIQGAPSRRDGSLDRGDAASAARSRNRGA